MKLAVTDANIFIDLFYLGIAEYLFKIDCEIYTTSYVLAELEDQHALQLEVYKKDNRLIIEAPGVGDEQSMIQLRMRKGLSESDRSVLCIAARLQATVLSGDDLVRKTCHAEGIEIHGILWCLNKFVVNKQITNSEACAALKKLMLYNSRLPAKHCKEYIINKWNGTFE